MDWSSPICRSLLIRTNVARDEACGLHPLRSQARTLVSNRELTEGWGSSLPADNDDSAGADTSCPKTRRPIPMTSVFPKQGHCSAEFQSLHRMAAPSLPRSHLLQKCEEIEIHPCMRPSLSHTRESASRRLIFSLILSSGPGILYDSKDPTPLRRSHHHRPSTRLVVFEAPPPF